MTYATARGVRAVRNIHTGPRMKPSLLVPSCIAAAVSLAWAPAAFAAVDNAEVQRLTQELNLLKQRYAAQQRTLDQLETRIKALAAASGAPPATAAAGSSAGAAATAGGDFAAAGGAAGSGAAIGTVQQAAAQDIPPQKSVEDIYQNASGFLTGSRFSLEAGLTYSHYDSRQLNVSGFYALDSILLGSINLDRIKSNTFTFDLTGRMSLGDRWQFDANIPFLYRYSDYITQTGTAVPIEANVSSGPAIGDASFGLAYKLVKEDESWPDIVGSLRVRAPTGREPYGIKLVTRDQSGNQVLATPNELPTGNGVWAVTAGMSFVKTVDPVVLFANLGYTYNIRRHFDDISQQVGQTLPGHVKLGDSIQLGMGMAFALNDRMSLGMSYSSSIARKTRIQYDGQSEQDVLNSDTHAAAFNFGLTWVVNKNLSVVPNLAIGLTPDSPDYSLSIRFPYNF